MDDTARTYTVYALHDVSEIERAAIRQALEHSRLETSLRRSVKRYHHIIRERLYLDGFGGTMRAAVSIGA